MFAEETLCPTIGQAAKGSGLSLRSLYRYFADPAGLLEAVLPAAASGRRGRTAANRALMRDQLLRQFEPELGAFAAERRQHVLSAGDLLT
jgi:AcrR family transcriptional regulator